MTIITVYISRHKGDVLSYRHSDIDSAIAFATKQYEKPCVISYSVTIADGNRLGVVAHQHKE